MSTAELEKQQAAPTIRLRRAPRCDPPFDDEREPEAWSSPHQLTLDWSRLTARASGSRRAATSSESPASTASSAPFDSSAASERAARRSPVIGASADAKLAVRRFVGSCVEVLNGYRPAAHLRRLAQPREAATVVAEGLVGAQRVAEARRLHTRFRRPAPVAVLRSSLCEPRPGAVEAAVLLLIGDRTWAMALRLEQHDEAWLATVLRLI